MANAVSQLNDAFDALRMAGQRLRDADRALRVEHDRANRAESKIARVEALADDMASALRGEIAPVRGVAALIRATLADPEEATDAQA